MPQILINREPLKHLNFDVELLGDCDVIVNELCHRISNSWSSLCTTDTPGSEITRDELLTPPCQSPVRIPLSEENIAEPSKGDSDKSVASRIDDEVNNIEATDKTDPNENTDNNPDKYDKELVDSKTGVSEQVEINANEPVIPKDSSDEPPQTSPKPESSGSVKEQGANGAESSTGNSNSSEKEISQDPGVSSSSAMPGSSSTSEKDLEEVRACWQPRLINLASRLQGMGFLSYHVCFTSII